jgi:hypothetical protein
MTLSPDVRQRILEAARSQPAPTRRQVRLRHFAYAGLAVAGTLAAFFAVGGPRPGPRPLTLVVATAMGAFAVAAVALYAVLGRSRGMLGRARAWLLGIALLAPAGFLGWKTALSGHFDMTDPWATRPGFRCFMLTVAFALLPFAVLMVTRRHSDPTHPRSLGLALGVAAGMSGGALVDLWCPVGHLSHLVVGHLLPTALLGLLGAWIGQRLLGIHGGPTPR